MIEFEEEESKGQVLSLHDEHLDKHKIMVEDAVPTNPKAFEVVDPIKGSHVTYTVKWYDEDGEFEGNRRYNDFYHLRVGLLNRMPGIFIPSIPPKKAIGNKNDRFLEERKYFLQRFLRLSCRIQNIIKSEEFRLFSRPSGDVEKTLGMLPKMTPEKIYERLITEFELSEEENPKEVEENKAVINNYSAFIK